jgi:beta-lactamase superfamily II metal-dependent hydrolase
VATHWDGDHIGGLARLVDIAQASDFVVSGALFGKEFLTLIRLYNNAHFTTTSDVKEYAKVLDILESRKKQPILASQQMTLWNRNNAGNEVAALVALAPSNAELIEGHRNVADMLTSKQLRDTNRNHRSVVLWLRVENAVALLGSDLEELNDKQRGWSAIILSEVKRSKAQVFKVPHHGSSSSHHDQIWTELLTKTPPALIAPWRKGNKALPTTADIQRIQKLTEHLYVTTIPQNLHKSRPADINKIIRATAKSIRTVDESLGHIRLRAKFKDPKPVWDVALFHGARKIQGQMAKAFPKPT